MRGVCLLCAVGIALGQQAIKQTQEGDRLAEAGRYQEAKVAYQLALRVEDMPADPVVQASMWNDLAMINRVLGNLVEARPQYQRALELMEQARGPGSSEYATILHNLAVLDRAAGRLDEAALKFHRALKIREDVLGGNDPATAQTLNSLAAVYAGQKRYAEAERLSRRALTIKEKALGSEDRRLVPTLDNLTSSSAPAAPVRRCARTDRTSLRYCGKTYGDGHPFTAQRMINRAIVLAYLGRYPEDGRTSPPGARNSTGRPGREQRGGGIHYVAAGCSQVSPAIASRGGVTVSSGAGDIRAGSRGQWPGSGRRSCELWLGAAPNRPKGTGKETGSAGTRNSSHAPGR